MNSILSYILTSGFSITAILLLFYFTPKYFMHWMAIIDRGFYKISSFWPSLKMIFDRRAVASTIKDVVNSVCFRINEEAPDCIPHPLQIEWIKTGKEDKFIKDGEVIVRLKHFSNQDRNIVNVTMMFLDIGFLPGAKNYLDYFLYKSCELKIASKIFMADSSSGAYDYFYQNIFEPVSKSNNLIKNNLQLINDLDSAGFFTHVFLLEVRQTGNKLLGTLSNIEIENELRKFANFLRTIANKAEDEDVPLKFRGVRTKVAVVLVARRETINLYGTTPYINAVLQNVKEGFDNIYISAWGNDFVEKVIEIKNELNKKVVTILRSYKTIVRGSVNGIIIVCQPNFSFLANKIKMSDEIKNIIDEAVPLVKRGIINVESIARVRNSGLKIVVKWSSPSRSDHYRAVGMCIGKNSDNIRIISSKFPNEFIHFISWSDNQKELIINSLFPLKPDQINGIEFDEMNNIANVFTNSDEAYRNALGRYNMNAKLAGELLGVYINVVSPEYFENNVTPEGELQNLLIKNIPAIRDGLVDIVKIVRIKGFGSRVIVKWADQADKGKKWASQECKGFKNEYFNNIKIDLKGEWLYFHEYTTNLKKRLIQCLHPFKEKNILSLDFDDNSNTAIVIFNEENDSPNYWQNSFRLISAERIIGWKIELR